MKIEVRDLEFSYGEATIFKDINLDINEAELTCILGPNGVGKSTFMFCINKLLKPTSGKVLIDGMNVAETSFKDLSKIMSFVPHSEDATFSLSVMETVLMGRQPHMGPVLTKKDLQIAAENIKLLGISDLSDRGFNELSAGQHQRVMIARGLTQEPKVLLLDEPTANLDVRYQMLVMRMLRDIARVKKISIIVICHDLNVTSLYADRILLLSKGGVYADGTSEEVLTADNIREVYGVETRVTMEQGRPHIIIQDSDSLDSHIEELAKDMIGNEYDLLEEEKKELS